MSSEEKEEGDGFDFIEREMDIDGYVQEISELDAFGIIFLEGDDPPLLAEDHEEDMVLISTISTWTCRRACSRNL